MVVCVVIKKNVFFMYGDGVGFVGMVKDVGYGDFFLGCFLLNGF